MVRLWRQCYCVSTSISGQAFVSVAHVLCAYAHGCKMCCVPMHTGGACAVCLCTRVQDVAWGARGMIVVASGAAQSSSSGPLPLSHLDSAGIAGRLLAVANKDGATHGSCQRGQGCWQFEGG
jgi:hypothetical protein